MALSAHRFSANRCADIGPLHSCGEPWTLVGAAFNSLVMAEVTVLTESRMTTTGSKERQAAYRDYADNTPVLVPWGLFFRRNRTVHMD